MKSHRAVSYCYFDGDLGGAINIWFFADVFVLTWEECKDGDQANEGNYTRDECHQFPSVEAVIAFLENADIEIEGFTP